MGNDTPKNDEPAPASRALVPTESDPGPDGGAGAARPQSAFVTQLLACKGSFEAFRRYRRAGSGRAAAVYGRPGHPVKPAAALVERVL